MKKFAQIRPDQSEFALLMALLVANPGNFVEIIKIIILYFNTHI